MRPLALPLLLATLLWPAAAQAVKAPTRATWDRPAQHAVTKAGLLDHPGAWDGALTTGQLRDVRDALAARLGTAPADVDGPPAQRVSVTSFDAFLVRQLGLQDVADTVRAETAHAGLEPPASFGTEAVARQLGLRFDHPFPEGEALEQYPWEPITRAEAAWSLAQVLRFGGWEADGVRATFATYDLPAFSAAQRRVLRVAIAKEGMPYIWGGETDTASNLYGGQVHGGYDCSGLVWRAFKLTGNPAGRRIGGRTAAQMAGEIPRTQRLHLDETAPGDLLFFGTARFDQKATEARITHVGIALAPGWMVNSSSQGVTIAPVTGWRLDEFAWARRVL